MKLAYFCVSASFIGYNLTLTVLTVVMSIVVYNCHHRDAKRAPVPRFIRLVSYTTSGYSRPMQ